MSATSIVKLIERCELDSHADTCVAGANTLILETTGQKLYVYGFHEVLGPMPNIDIGKDATIWDCPTTGIPYMVIISEALFFGDKIAATLLTHNQLCANRIKVDHVPKQCEPKSCHSIHSFPKADEDIQIPLDMEGIISGFTTRKPTWEEYQDQVSFQRLQLTSDEPWKPTSDNFSVEEQCCVLSIRHLDQVIEEEEIAFENLHRHVAAAKS